MFQSPDIRQYLDGVIPNFQIFGKSLTKENFHNFRMIDDTDMKFEPVTKLDKRNKTTSKKLSVTLCEKIVTLLSFFQFMACLQLFRSWILDAESVKLMFSIIVTLNLTKTESKFKKLLT